MVIVVDLAAYFFHQLSKRVKSVCLSKLIFEFAKETFFVSILPICQGDTLSDIEILISLFFI